MVTESRTVVTGDLLGGGGRETQWWKKRGDIDQRVQTFSYKINKFWIHNIYMVNMLISLIEVIISQYMHMSKHPLYTLKNTICICQK